MRKKWDKNEEINSLSPELAAAAEAVIKPKRFLSQTHILREGEREECGARVIYTKGDEKK